MDTPGFHVSDAPPWHAGVRLEGRAFSRRGDTRDGAIFRLRAYLECEADAFDRALAVLNEFDES